MLGESVFRLGCGGLGKGETNEHDVDGFSAMHVWSLDIVDFFNEGIEAGGYLLWCSVFFSLLSWFSKKKIWWRLLDGLSLFAAISPDVPRGFFVQTLRFPAFADFAGQEAFVFAIVPFRERFGRGCFAAFDKGFLPDFVEEKVES